MDVSQWAIDPKLTPAERRRLDEIVRNGNTPQKMVPRARIALLSDGMRLNGAIAREVGISLPMQVCSATVHSKSPSALFWICSIRAILSSVIVVSLGVVACGNSAFLKMRDDQLRLPKYRLRSGRTGWGWAMLFARPQPVPS
jgi:hypothetical protein